MFTPALSAISAAQAKHDIFRWMTQKY